MGNSYEQHVKWVEHCKMRAAPVNFGFPPDQSKRGPVFNFRSEGRDFSWAHRCLVPASGFYEFTGSKYSNTKHRFALKDSLVTAGDRRHGDGIR